MYNTLRKIERDFKFDFQLQQKVVRNLRITTETVGWLTVVGRAEYYPERFDETDDMRFTIDYDFIYWNGCNILPVLKCDEVKGSSLMDEITDATYNHCYTLFNLETAA